MIAFGRVKRMKTPWLHAWRRYLVAGIVLISLDIAWSSDTQFSVEIAGYIGTNDIQEASGLAASRRQPGVLWTHNDKNDLPRFFALGTDGRSLGTFFLAEEDKCDFEDLAIGPGPEAGVDYLYLGDIGDNDEDRVSVRVFRIPEPWVDVNEMGVEEIVAAYDTLTLYYPDGPHDAETLMVDPWTGDVYLVTKGTQPTEVYRASFPQTAEMTLELVTTFSADWVISADDDFVGPTGGDIAPDGRQILIRGYDRGYLWTISRSDSPLWTVFEEAPLEVPLGWEEQGEAIAFAADSQEYFSTSEGPWCAIYRYRRSVFRLIAPPDTNNDGLVNFLDYAEVAGRIRCDQTAPTDYMSDNMKILANHWLQLTNEAPSNILPSQIVVGQDSPAALVVGRVQAQDADVRDLHRYSLVCGEGDQDNDYFEIRGDRLITAKPLERPIQDHYDIRIRCADRVGHCLERTLTITVGYDPHLILMDFTYGAGGFVYMDDVFGQTAQPAYADGYWDALNGDPNGALIVELGGLDDENIDGLSGGWRCRFDAPESSNRWQLRVSYRLWTHEKYGNKEYTEVLVDLDGTPMLGALGHAVDRLEGGGDTGWQSVCLPLGGLSAGPHDLTLGAYNNRKTHRDEMSRLFIDNVTICPEGFDP